MFTFFATFINLVQIFIFEREEWANFADTKISGRVVTYTICMFVLYSLAPVMFRLGSAVLYNLSILTSDFYGLIFGLGLFGYSVTVMYPFAYVVIIIGIGIYHIFPAPVPGIGNFTDEIAEKELKELHGIKHDDDVERQDTHVTDEVIPTLTTEAKN